MYIYISLLIFILFLNSNILKKYRISYMISFTMLLFFAGFRKNVGTDYRTYYEMYLGSTNKVYQNIEKGYLYINKLFLLNEIEFKYFMLFCSGIVCLNYYLFLRNKYLKNSILIYLVITTSYFFHMNGVRQGIAISFFLYATKFIVNKKIKKYIFYIIVASFFHKTAILLLPIYYIDRLKINRKKLAIIILIVLTFNIFNGYQIFVIKLLKIFKLHKYLRYFSEISYNYGSGIGVYVYLCVYFLILKFSSKEQFKDKEYKLYFLLYTIGIIFRIMALKNTIFMRMGYYFLIFEAVIIPYFIYQLKDKFRLIIIVLINCIYLIFFLKTIKSSHSLIPYSNYYFINNNFK